MERWITAEYAHLVLVLGYTSTQLSVLGYVGSQVEKMAVVVVYSRLFLLSFPRCLGSWRWYRWPKAWFVCATRWNWLRHWLYCLESFESRRKYNLVRDGKEWLVHQGLCGWRIPFNYYSGSEPTVPNDIFVVALLPSLVCVCEPGISRHTTSNDDCASIAASHWLRLYKKRNSPN